ncbi:MAG: hypothetical protein AAFY06_04145 [Pseudomonadota bacterium]
MPKSPFDTRHPFFRPLWRRAVATGLCFGWAGFEYLNGAPLWALLFAACGTYLFVQFFLRFDPAEYEKRDE